MLARLTCALLLMAAVFTAHGLSCAASDVGPSVSTVAASTSDLPVAADTAVVAAHHSPGTDTPGTDTSGHDSPGHGAMTHALLVCLAVLTGGVGAALAALAVWLSRHRSRVVTSRAGARQRPVLGRARSCVPAPDLARLCVLRV